jgi:nitroimidazol reductase NimA-like FMN-containing flavoprotein (pyridoxamine 5'-phosphate oxidase superfamily)
MQDLDRDTMINLLQTEREGVLAMCDDGQPYSLPFGYVLIDDSVYISLLPQGRKWACLQKNPRVCFTVFSWNDDRSAWASVVVEGKLEPVADLNIIRRVVHANAVKMSIEAIDEYVEKRMRYYEKTLNDPNGVKTTRIITEHMSGKTNPVVAGK